MVSFMLSYQVTLGEQMAKRKIIRIDHKRCNGCGLCIPNCPEGAIQLIDKKARLISDLFCDGLGACIGYCPQGAISIEEREAQKYDENKVMDNIVKQGQNTIKAHLIHLKEHNETGYFNQALDYLKEKGIENPLNKDGFGGDSIHNKGSCPGSKIMDLRKKGYGDTKKTLGAGSELRQWPVQLMLVPAHAPYLDNSDLLISADCVPFAYPDFHSEILKGKILLVGCPKLDNLAAYREKLNELFADNTIKSVTYAHMEVPCCSGLIGIIKEAIAASGKNIPFSDVTIGISGKRL